MNKFDLREFVSTVKVAATGHRPDKLWNDYDLISPGIAAIKKDIIVQLSEIHPSHLISGMALGVDTLFALIAMEMDIPLIAALPFRGQESKWPQKSQILYNQILNWKKTEVHVVCDGGYAPWKMQKRNEWMVDNCEHLIAVWDGTDGGTHNCVRYAKKVKKPVIRFNPDNYRKLLL